MPLSSGHRQTLGDASDTSEQALRSPPVTPALGLLCPWQMPEPTSASSRPLSLLHERPFAHASAHQMEASHPLGKLLVLTVGRVDPGAPITWPWEQAPAAEVKCGLRQDEQN